MKTSALAAALALATLHGPPGTAGASEPVRTAPALPPACRAGAPDCWLTVKPAEMDSHWAQARCNDGSAAGYEFRPSPTGSKNWVILFEGGGSCDDLTLQCANRNHRLTTTSPIGNGQWRRIPHAGILNPLPTVNPDFYAANLVQLNYCSSDQWSGATSLRRITSATPGCTDASTCGWYFSGRANVQAALESLQREHGLVDDGSQRVLFVGTSAGGFGLAANAEALTTLLPVTHQADRLRFVIDGAFVLDGWDVPGHTIGDSHLTNVNAVAAQNRRFWRARFDTFCEADRIARGLDPSLCTFLSVDYSYLTSATNGLGLKVLLQNSTLDAVAVARLGLDDLNDPAREEWRCRMTQALAAAPWLFSSGDVYHTLSGSNTAFNAGQNGRTYRDLVGRFWRDETPRRYVYRNPACP
ncbi:pectinacetylesterase family protein [Tahibacter amnicola]|uniref:Pectinacetylesterase family protein n=1 Tax=Tahibacter amnicola TaxID=2976241 RepID=A0ABY6BK19_9GAMM|nr:pectinacetylesterase family protein [Tahibacter amnicola]UXI70119.1 pectinacetylesterase family protein [Tahibacter amnicola]